MISTYLCVGRVRFVIETGIMSLSISAYVTAVQMGRLLFGRILSSAAPVAAATVAAFAASAAAAGLKRAAASKRWPLPPR